METGSGAQFLATLNDIGKTLSTIANAIPAASATGATGTAGTSVPATSDATGTAGQIEVDQNWLYVCIATNSWKRIALSSF